MTLTHLPALPSPPSWFPGHMVKFTRMLPALLKRTNVVLELRDSRLPLTSINRTLEGVLLNFCVSLGQGHYSGDGMLGFRIAFLLLPMCIEYNVHCSVLFFETMPGLAAKASHSHLSFHRRLSILIVIHFRFRCIEKVEA